MMHWIQEKLLILAGLHDINAMKLVELVEMVGCEHPSQIQHHKKQLIAKGKLLSSNGRLVPALATVQGLITIPVLGEADCGEATKYADGRIVDNLVVSPSILAVKHPERVYALVARGSSMDMTDVKGKSINDGDYVIVEKTDGYTPDDGDVVVSNIGGLANIKRFQRDKSHHRILLLPESSRDYYAPIIIHENDDYTVQGKVIDVVRGIAL